VEEPRATRTGDQGVQNVGRVERTRETITVLAGNEKIKGRGKMTYEADYLFRVITNSSRRNQ